MFCGNVVELKLLVYTFYSKKLYLLAVKDQIKSQINALPSTASVSTGRYPAKRNK